MENLEIPKQSSNLNDKPILPRKEVVLTIGPTMGIIIILAVLVVGALYFLGGKFQKEKLSPTNTGTPTEIQTEN